MMYTCTTADHRTKSDSKLDLKMTQDAGSCSAFTLQPGTRTADIVFSVSSLLFPSLAFYVTLFGC